MTQIFNKNLLIKKVRSFFLFLLLLSSITIFSSIGLTLPIEKKKSSSSSEKENRDEQRDPDSRYNGKERNRNFPYISENTINSSIISGTTIDSILLFLRLQSDQKYLLRNFVNVDNPGNLPDPYAYPHYWGSVDYEFEIGKKMVTQKEYLDCLNLVTEEEAAFLYNDKMVSLIKKTEGDSLHRYELVNPTQGEDPMTLVSYNNIEYYRELLQKRENQKMENPMEKKREEYATYRIINNDEYQKAIYYNPTILSGHGAYEQKPKHYYGTEPFRNNIAEWTSTIDPYSGKQIIRRGGFSKDNNSPPLPNCSFETADPDEVREDLGFRIVKVVEPSFVSNVILQKDREEQEALIRSEDPTKSQEEKHVWELIAYSMRQRNDQINSPELAHGYEEAVSYYIEEMRIWPASNECQKHASYMWEATGYFTTLALDSEIRGSISDLNKKRFEELHRYFFQAAKYFAAGDKGMGYCYWNQATYIDLMRLDDPNE